MGFGGHTFRTASRRPGEQKIGAFQRARSSQVLIDSAYGVADVADADVSPRSHSSLKQRSGF